MKAIKTIKENEATLAPTIASVDIAAACELVTNARLAYNEANALASARMKALDNAGYSLFKDKKASPEWKAWSESADSVTYTGLVLKRDEMYVKALETVRLRQIAQLISQAVLASDIVQSPMWYKAFGKNLIKACKTYGLQAEYSIHERTGNQILAVCDTTVWIDSRMGRICLSHSRACDVDIYCKDYSTSNLDKAVLSRDALEKYANSHYQDITANDVWTDICQYSDDMGALNQAYKTYRELYSEIAHKYSKYGIEVKER